jgi:hypothetical protein
MDTHTLHAVNNVLQKQAGCRLPVNPLADSLFNKLASTMEQSHGVTQTRKDDNSSAKPSSNSSKGMEDKNDGYGRSDKKLDDDPSKDGAQETGAVQVAHAGTNVTTEHEGMKDLSIPHHNKKASLDFLRRTNPGRKQRILASLKGLR